MVPIIKFKNNANKKRKPGIHRRAASRNGGVHRARGRAQTLRRRLQDQDLQRLPPPRPALTRH